MQTKKQLNNTNNMEELFEELEKIDKIYSQKIQDLDNDFINYKNQLMNLTNNLTPEICKYDEIPFELTEYELKEASDKYWHTLHELFKFGKSDLEGSCKMYKDEVIKAYKNGISIETIKKYVQNILDRKFNLKTLFEDEQSRRTTDMF